MSIDLFNYDYVPAGEPIKTIEHGFIFFVHDGRNAWHSTWVQKYYPGCMHSTLDEAKKYCEKKRTNGSVFYITEIPVIIVCFRYGKLIATQLNTNMPFESYHPQNDTIPGDGTRQEKRSMPSTIEEITTSLNTGCSHWKQPQQHNQPVILLWMFDPSAYITPVENRPLIKYKSFSHGKKYLLGWSTLDKSINPTRIIEIVDSYELEQRASKVRNISSTRTTKNSSTACPHEQAVKDTAYSICGRLTKTYGKAVHLQEIIKLDSNTFQARLCVEIFKKIRSITYMISIDSNAKVNGIKLVESHSEI